MKLDTSTDPQVGYRPPGSLDMSSALAPYAGSFGRRDAAHLLRRAGFGGTLSEIDTLASLGVAGAAYSMLHPAAEVEFAPFPDAAPADTRQQRVLAAQNWWLDRMLRTRRPLIEKMALFWHGHFATSIRKVPPPLMVQQIELFRTRGLGNFRPLLGAVSQDPAMLIWLDNRFNNKVHPNENYAREAMELFTLGLGNYSEEDVKNAARAFTGWTLDSDLNFIYRPQRHDDGPKTFLGRNGNFSGEEALDIIVQQPSHPRFIARKLLEFFVYSDPEPALIEGLAQTYALSGYDIAQTVGTILRSNVFYSARAYRALPKSPLEFGVGLLRFMEVRAVPADTVAWLRRMGQEPLAPPSVKGWDGGPTWINTATLLARFNYVNRIAKAAPPRMNGPGSAADDTFPAFTPDRIVAEAGAMSAEAILAAVTRDAVQDDVTSAVRSMLLAYLQSAGASLPTPLGAENYQDKIRGVLALTLNLPSNQLN